LAASGRCTECGRQVGRTHNKDCYLGQPEEGEDFDGVVDENDTTLVVDAPGIWAMVRTDPATGDRQAIGYVQRASEPANPTAIEQRGEILAEIVKQSKAKFGPAGPLWDNAGAFASVKLPEPVKV